MWDNHQHQSILACGPAFFCVCSNEPGLREVKKQAGMLYKVCLVSPRTGHLVKWKLQQALEIWERTVIVCVSCGRLGLSLSWHLFMPSFLLSLFQNPIPTLPTLCSGQNNVFEWKHFHDQHNVAASGKLRQIEESMTFHPSCLGFLNPDIIVCHHY